MLDVLRCAVIRCLDCTHEPSCKLLSCEMGKVFTRFISKYL